MNKILTKVYEFIEKIGKPNFILLLFIIIVLVITSLYTTFSLYTSSEGLSIIDGIETYKFIIDASNNNRSVTIASNSSKNVAITVNNPENIKLKYGIYYSSEDNLDKVELGYLDTSDYKATDIIDSNSDAIVTIKVYNDSNTSITINFGLSYGLDSGGELKLSDNKKWVDKLSFERFKLNEAKTGSYVSYTGKNNCTGEACSGKNANYVNDEDKGYCDTEENKFIASGWRIAYINEDTAYLISAGSPECITLDKANNTEDLNILNETVLKYCDPALIYGGICSNLNTWNMNTNDFYYITNNKLFYNTITDNSCYESSDNKNCGYENDLIDIGSSYWIDEEFSSIDLTYTWSPLDKYITYGVTNNNYGIRPILRMDDNIEVIGGKGTYKEPYIIRNTNNFIEDE